MCNSHLSRIVQYSSDINASFFHKALVTQCGQYTVRACVELLLANCLRIRNNVAQSCMVHNMIPSSRSATRPAKLKLFIIMYFLK